MEKLRGVLNDPESMQLIQVLASMLGGGEKPNEQPPPADMPDLTKLMQLQGAMSQAGKGDKNIALLMALRPLLKEENQAKLDRIVKLFRLMAIWPVLRESGLLGGDLFGGL